MISSLMALALVALPLLAAGDKKETGRLENCGLIVKEVMDIPDNIPEDLINKAECIIVYPSVLKAAFVIGGSYRSEEHTSELQSHVNLVCRLLLEKKKKKKSI